MIFDLSSIVYISALFIFVFGVFNGTSRNRSKIKSSAIKAVAIVMIALVIVALI